MSTTKKTNKSSKHSRASVKDLGPKADPRGGRKPGHVAHIRPARPARHPVSSTIHLLEP